MTTFVLLTITGLGLAALYFLVASGLSLIFGLMDVLNFAHGVFLSAGAYAAWAASTNLTAVGSPTLRFLLALLVGVAAGGLFAALIEVTLIRRLYGQHVAQILLTVGLALGLTALIRVIWSPDTRVFPTPPWMRETTDVFGAAVPNTRFVAIGGAALVLGALVAFLKRTRYGLIIRAGVENRAMVSALGIDVTRAFSAVFAIGGLAAGLGGVLLGAFDGSINPDQGGRFLIFAFIVTIIGGLGSLTGAAVASVLVGLTQQYANFYAAFGIGDLTVILLLAVVLLVRPEGLAGTRAAR